MNGKPIVVGGQRTNNNDNLLSGKGIMRLSFVFLASAFSGFLSLDYDRCSSSGIFGDALLIYQD